MPPIVDPEEGGPAGSLRYRVYANDGLGGPIDYATPVLETAGTSWTSAPLAPSGSYRFGVRVHDAATGLEESNIDAATTLILNDQGEDVTRTPLAPDGLRAVPLAGGRVRLEWTLATAPPGREPIHVNIYLSPGALVSYASPTATAAVSPGGFGFIELGGLVDGATYAAAARAVGAAGEEANAATVLFQADATPPAAIDMLQASATSQAGA